MRRGDAPVHAWQVYVQPSGMVGFNGLESVGIFVRGMLDKIKAR